VESLLVTVGGKYGGKRLQLEDLLVFGIEPQLGCPDVYIARTFASWGHEVCLKT
jgi:hypothetical protein